jgi:hypothetical protein
LSGDKIRDWLCVEIFGLPIGMWLAIAFVTLANFSDWIILWATS